MADIFDKDAPYGLPTGVSLTSHLKNVDEKLWRLNALYTATYPNEDMTRECFS